MLKIGLTGGISSGKSLVSKIFTELGAHSIDADEIAHELMRPGEAVYDEVVQKFGKEVLNPDGTVNRARLAELAFDKRRPRIYELNRIVHPVVIRSQDAWMQEMGRQDPHAVAIVEAALLLEAGERFDRLIVVTCSAEQRVARFAARQKIDLQAARKEVVRRMAAQLPDEEKIKAADHVIDNSGSLEKTREQVPAVWEKLQSEATES